MRKNVRNSILKAEGMELVTNSGITRLSFTNVFGTAIVGLSLNALHLRNINDQLLLSGKDDGVVSMYELEVSDRLSVNGKEIVGGGKTLLFNRLQSEERRVA